MEKNQEDEVSWKPREENVQKGGYGLLFGIFSKKISKMMTEIQY